MSKSESRAKLASAAIAQVRKSLQSFTLADLTKNLKKAGCPYASAVSSELANKGLIVKSKNREYSFIATGPIHFSTFVQPLDIAANTVKRYVDTYHEKMNNSTSKINDEEMIELLKVKGFRVIKKAGEAKMTDEEMIESLKAKGYRILKPITNFEEC